MFGLKWLTPEHIALLGATVASGGATAPALAGETAGAGAGGFLSGISAADALAGTEASLAGNVGAGITGSIPAMGESYFGAAPGMGGSSMYDKMMGLGTQAKDYLDEANKVIKPVGQALGAAKTAQGLLSPSAPPMQAPAPHMGGGGNPVYAGLLQEQQAQSQARTQEEMQRRAAQQKLLSMMGGR